MGKIGIDLSDRVREVVDFFINCAQQEGFFRTPAFTYEQTISVPYISDDYQKE